MTPTLQSVTRPPSRPLSTRAARRRQRSLSWIVAAIMITIFGLAIGDLVWKSAVRKGTLGTGRLVMPVIAGHFSILAWEYRDRNNHPCGEIMHSPDAPPHEYTFVMLAPDATVSFSSPTTWDSDSEAMSAMAQVCDEKAKGAGK